MLGTFANRSTRTIQDIEFSFAAREAGRSANFLIGDNYLKSDVIIAPRNTVKLFWVMPKAKTSSAEAAVYYSVIVSYTSDQAAS